MSASRGGLPDDSFRVSGRREGLLCATMELNKDHIVIEARDASPLADLVRAQAFSQSDDLRAQSLAAKLTLELDHLVTRLTGAKACKPVFVTPARLLLGHRRRLVCRLRYRRRKRQLLFQPLGLCLRPLVFILAPLGGLAGGRFPLQNLQAISGVRRPGG